jgi:uncharacterized membrane protein
MAGDNYRELNGKKSVGVSIVLTFIFWAFFTRMLLPFVPAETIGRQYFFAAFTALCLSGVFYMASQMFMLVLAEHRKAKRDGV